MDNKEDLLFIVHFAVDSHMLLRFMVGKKGVI